ncbi:MAG TPA: M28 family peptidase [Gemmatimonadetes bacterium]|nr:M28 family peptidase [Gemmatimonadota bacterium]
MPHQRWAINKDIPAIFFTTWDHEDYHKPSDEVELIDSEKAARVARMVFYLGARIADGVVSPEWTETGLAEVHRILERGN